MLHECMRSPHTFGCGLRLTVPRHLHQKSMSCKNIPLGKNTEMNVVDLKNNLDHQDYSMHGGPGKIGKVRRRQFY